MTNDELAAIKARADAAAPGPLVADGPHTHNGLWDVRTPYVDGFCCTILYNVTERDAVFFAAARRDISALVDEVERLKAAMNAAPPAPPPW